MDVNGEGYSCSCVFNILGECQCQEKTEVIGSMELNYVFYVKKRKLNRELNISTRSMPQEIS